MGRIRIDTEHVREVGRRFSIMSERIAAISHRVGQAVGSLDTGAWDGESRARAEPLLARASPAAARLAEDLERLGCTLTHAAEVFEQEDATASRQLERMAWIEWIGGGAAFAVAGGPDDDNPGFEGVETASGAVYALVDGQPFILGRRDDVDIHPNDLTQGALGDCYLISSLAVIAAQRPELIRRLIRDNGDGTYTVMLHQARHPLAFWEPDYEPVEVVVTPEFPVDDGLPVFAHPGDTVDQQRELWPMLVEKAYAQQNGSYGEIRGGWGATAMGALTGVASERVSPDAVDIAELAGYNEEGYGITASSLGDYRIALDEEVVWDIPDRTDVDPLYLDGTLVSNHEYYVAGVDVEGGTVTVRNPWGWGYGETVLTYEEFRRAFRWVSLNPLVAPSE